MERRETPTQARQPKTSEYFDQQLEKQESIDLRENSEVIVDFGPTVDRILEQAGKRNADLIVMGLHHRNEIETRIAAHLPGSIFSPCHLTGI